MFEMGFSMENTLLQYWKIHSLKYTIRTKCPLQSGEFSHAKHGGAYFSAVYGSIKDPIAAPRKYKPQEC